MRSSQSFVSYICPMLRVSLSKDLKNIKRCGRHRCAINRSAERKYCLVQKTKAKLPYDQVKEEREKHNIPLCPEQQPAQFKGVSTLKSKLWIVVQAAVKAWGQRGLLELEAEERLAIACEKSPTQDSVIAQLRKAFNVSLLNLPLFVDVCSMQIITDKRYLPGDNRCTAKRRRTFLVFAPDKVLCKDLECFII